MAPSPSNEYPGTPYIPGVILTVITAIIAAVALYFGYRPLRRSAFAKLCGIAPMIVTLHNIYILSAFGLSGASVISALGFTVIGQGSHPHAAFRAWVASILLGLITIGVTVLLNRRLSTRSPIQMGQVMPSVTTTQQPLHPSYHTYTR